MESNFLELTELSFCLDDTCWSNDEYVKRDGVSTSKVFIPKGKLKYVSVKKLPVCTLDIDKRFKNNKSLGSYTHVMIENASFIQVIRVLETKKEILQRIEQIIN